jgi:hypothetical protein
LRSLKRSVYGQNYAFETSNKSLADTYFSFPIHIELEIDSASAMSIDATRKLDLYITYIANISYTVMACDCLWTNKGKIESFSPKLLAGGFRLGVMPTTFTGDSNMIRTLSYAAVVALAFVLPAAAENAKVNVPATASDISSAANGTSQGDTGFSGKT